jgi:hypothetical protein
MYYIPAAAGSVVTAQSAVLNGDFSQWSPYKDSYRVLLANRSILGTPSTSDQWGMHFIMTPPPPPPVGAGIIDASGSTGSQLLRVDQSISRVKLGAGAVTVQRESFNTSVAFVLNPGMAQGSVATIFENLNLDYDVVTLNRFTNVNDIKVKVEATFDTHSNAPAIAQYYKQFATTVRVSFSADVAGASRPFDFLVLVQSDANMSATQLRDKVRSRIATT